MQTLCIPATCATYVVQSGDSCDAIASSKGISFSDILTYNPVLDNFCTNLIAGESICVSPPGGVVSLTTIPGNTVTQTAIYGTSTASRPSPVPTDTTRNCAKYYLVQPGDYCQLVALNQTVDLSLFEAMNPQIDSACDNLLSGFYYCVKPVQNWNGTTTSTTVTAPTTTPSGTTIDCYQYVVNRPPSTTHTIHSIRYTTHYILYTTQREQAGSHGYRYYTVQSGDYCGKIQDAFGISFAQFQYWNPSLKSDCSNLLLGEAYCVNGVYQPPAASPTGASAGASNSNKKRAMQLVPQETGGVPHGWPGLKARSFVGGVGAAKREL